jgi:glycogen operon protein
VNRHGGQAVVTPPIERIDSYPTESLAGYQVRPGRPLPFGAYLVPGGINFSVYSNHATDMTLVLFRRGEQQPLAELPFPPSFRVGSVFAMTVFGLAADEIEYGYRADGPFAPSEGHRFDPAALVSDPYARLLGGAEHWGAPPMRSPLRSGVAYTDFDWDGDGPLHVRHEDLVIYELHVRGFTRHSSSAVAAPGTYAGLVEKIPYLTGLGVNCVELMPVFEFSELDNPRAEPESGRRLYNYWGYNPAGFFAPKASYAETGADGLQVDEFKNMIKQFHRAGIEVVLDVVFNHTAEGNEQGPLISFRGLDNSTYYMLTPEGDYYNFSGTGNTLNCNHPVVRGFVLDCLRYWVTEFHVDGFRFDLAAVLGRAPDGSVLANPPLLETLAYDPILRDCMLIAEAWDAAGLYQVGTFPKYRRWSEWNGRYRDTIRRFIKSDAGMVGEMATRLAGSADLYAGAGAAASINFITVHDGFTLRDLVSYDAKHNEANGEQNQDGDDNNNSWNCGHEGETSDPEVCALRDRQTRNALLLLLASRGIPMLLAGDEAGRTQHGNNNAYCHDELSWFDWDLTRDNEALLRFARHAIAFRKAHPALRSAKPAEPPAEPGWFPELSWHGTRAWQADWSPESRLLAAMFCTPAEGTCDCVYVAANTHWLQQELELPTLPDGQAWHVFADTGNRPPRDICAPGTEAPAADQAGIRIGPRSVLVLTARQLRT